MVDWWFGIVGRVGGGDVVIDGSGIGYVGCCWEWKL